MAKSNEPIWWSLFSAGGVVAAFTVPILIFLTGIAWPLGWVPEDTLALTKLQTLLSNPLARLFCFIVISLPLFNWAHRFRYTLMDLGVKSMHTLIAVLCYGAAITGTIITAVVLWG